MDVQETLIDGDPHRFFRPPYVGPRGWIGVVLDTKPDSSGTKRRVRCVGQRLELGANVLDGPPPQWPLCCRARR